MSEVIPHMNVVKHIGRLRKYHSPLVRLDFAKGATSVRVEMSDGTAGRGSCLGCHDTPCMILSRSDTNLPDVLSDFPSDPATEVCPTRAINWDQVSEAPKVDVSSCIGCGLCAVRCPYGSISLNSTGYAVIESTDPDQLTTKSVDCKVNTTHETPRRIGTIGPSDIPSLQEIPQKFCNLKDTQRKQLVRNLLIESGLKCRVRRQGDTNIRMDGVFVTTDNRMGVLEFEFGNSYLDVPRALLEDLAVLHSRYELDVKTVVPLSVLSQLPNERSEYYQIISDIEKVLGLRIRTITLGVLIVIVWQFQKILGFPGRLFLTDPEEFNFKNCMKKQFPGKISEFEPYPRAYRPIK